MLILMQDFHIHSGLIEHTEDNIFLLSKKAKELGFSEITVLEHFSPFKIRYPENSDPSNTLFTDTIPKEYLRRTSTIAELVGQCEIAEKKLGIKINKSLEVDFHKDYEKDIKQLDIFNLDYLTLSCHYIEVPGAIDKEKLVHIGFKENMDFFLENFGEDVLYKLYFENLLNGVRSGLFMVVAHFDFFARYLKNYDPLKALKYAEPIIQEMIERDIGMEINLAKEPFQPAIEIINLYKSLGGKKFFIGSDSHSVSDLENSLEKRRKLPPSIFI